MSEQKNKMPRGRFLVNLEVHSGSVDEDEDEQGIAHFLEHMLFLGTEKFPTPDAMRTASAVAPARSRFRSRICHLWTWPPPRSSKRRSTPAAKN